jgi:TRAP-type uncharacterized transport system fused permease subunit
MPQVEERPSNLLEQSIDDENIQKLVEKYDTESRYRILDGLTGKIVVALLVAMSCYHLYTAGFGLLPISIHRAIHMTFAITAVFLLYPATSKSSRTSIPWYDWILALLAAGGSGYIVFFFNDIARRGAQVQSYELWLGLGFMVLVLEAGRRIVGKVLPTLAFLFLRRKR